MNMLNALARLLIFPGLLLAVPAAWFVLWLERKSVAVMQRRIGPPFGQPAFDFIKLLGKATPRRAGLGGTLMRAWTFIAACSAAGAVGLLPLLPSLGGFEGDLILLLALMEIPAICLIVAGFTSNSLFGQIGSAREAVLLVSYNLLFLLAAVSIAVSGHSFRLEALASAPLSYSRYLGLFAILLCLPAKLHVNPFSLPNAEQEIYSGPMTEYAGFELALWQLSHGLEWIAGIGFVASLAIPGSFAAMLQIVSIVFLTLLLVLLLSFLAAATARVAIDTAVRFYCQCAVAFIVVVLSCALIVRGRS
jgi:NADH-quinone oxidoreductase subunit H